MHKVEHHKDLPVFETKGLLFYVSSLKDSIHDHRRGLWINANYVKDNPVLCTINHENMKLYFIAIDPLSNLKSREDVISSWEKRGKSNDDASVSVYADWTKDILSYRNLIEKTIDDECKTEDEPKELREMAYEILDVSYDYSKKFINSVRRCHKQYWLKEPNFLDFWDAILYFSLKHQSWYSIVVQDDIVPVDWERKVENTKKEYTEKISLKYISSKDDLNELTFPKKQSFADEMISIALVELSEKKVRSAILHAIIALESVSKMALGFLLSIKMERLNETNLLEAISKELSVPQLCQLVHYHLFEDISALIQPNWREIDSLYQTRNAVVHRGQRKFNDFERLKSQILEVYELIRGLEDKINNLIEMK